MSPNGILLFATVLFMVYSILSTFPMTRSVYGTEVFTKVESPFGISYNDWFSKYWNWTASLNMDEFTPKPGGCVFDNSSMVMLIDTTVQGSPQMVCDISSEQGVMIPLWIAWCDNHEKPNYTGEQLTKCAREQYNLGNIGSEVTVDGQRVADLDVRMSLESGKLNYKINSLDNVTEISSKGFNLTLPPDSRLLPSGTPPGTWLAGAHGWFVFLKPLPPGEHTVFYNVRVTPTGALTSPGTSPHASDVAYDLHVK
jgi:hypothetical protein